MTDTKPEDMSSVELALELENLHVEFEHSHPYVVEAARRMKAMGAMEELRKAIEFFDKVKSAPEADQIAVGADHWVRLERAARSAVKGVRAL